ncbi:MAG: cytochrome P450 [Gemmatimonadales bacterium]
MSGPEAARVFHRTDHLTRDTLPSTSLQVLDRRGAERLDVALEAERLAAAMAREWLLTVPRWGSLPSVTLHSGMRDVLLRTACTWAGIPLSEKTVAARRRELGTVIDHAGSFGPRGWWAWLMRARTERWARRVIRWARRRHGRVPEDDPVRKSRDSSKDALALIAEYRDPSGALLPVGVAAAELTDVLRATLVTARLVTFAALALHEHERAAKELRADPGRAARRRFAREVRRYYPCFATIGGRVRRGFEWRDRWFEPGERVLFDLHGTNHDERCWDRPHEFRPQRFADVDGGDPERAHRYPGEWAVDALLDAALDLLVRRTAYEVPPQDLEVARSPAPVIPRSGFVIRNVRLLPS